MSLRAIICLFAAVLLSGIAPTSAVDACPVCGGPVVKVGTVTDDRTQPSKNIHVWNRSICANMFYHDDSDICTRCWMAHSTQSQRWERSSELRDSFHRPLSAAIHDFPLPAAQDIKSLVVYSQKIIGAQVTESVAFWCTDSPDLIKRFRAYARDHGLSMLITPQDRARHEISVSIGTRNVGGQALR